MAAAQEQPTTRHTAVLLCLVVFSTLLLQAWSYSSVALSLTPVINAADFDGAEEGLGASGDVVSGC